MIRHKITLNSTTTADKQTEAELLGFVFTTVDTGINISFVEKSSHISSGEISFARSQFESIAKQIYPDKQTHFFVKPALKNLTYSFGVGDTVNNALMAAE